MAAAPNLNDFARLLDAEERARSVYGRFADKPLVLSSSRNVLERDFGIGFLRDAYQDQRTAPLLKKLHREAFEQSTGPDGAFINTDFEFMQHLYDVERPLDVLAKLDLNDPEDEAVRGMMLSKGAMRWMYNNDPRTDTNLSENDALTESYRSWMRDIVLAATEITEPELADDYVFAAAHDRTDRETLVGDIVHKIDSIGLEGLADLRRYSGICALSDYSLEQLERMVKVAHNDPTELARLKDHDLTVVFTNKMGDHNNILHTNPAMIDDERGRSLFFEMQGVHDIYRAMFRLRAQGLKPASIVIAAHGYPGLLSLKSKPSISGARPVDDVLVIHKPALVQQVNDTTASEGNFRGYALHGMKPLSKLVDEGMQPSRGVDDAAATVGHKKIVFVTCEAAKEAPQRDLDPQTAKGFEIGTASIAGQLATDLATHSKSSVIEIYGATESIQARDVRRGIEYSGRRDDEFGRSHLAVTRFTVQNGKVTSDEVSEIPLRNFDKQQLVPREI